MTFGARPCSTTSAMTLAPERSGVPSFGLLSPPATIRTSVNSTWAPASPGSFSMVTTSFGATRYCLPPVLMTAYIIDFLDLSYDERPRRAPRPTSGALLWRGPAKSTAQRAGGGPKRAGPRAFMFHATIAAANGSGASLHASRRHSIWTAVPSRRLASAATAEAACLASQRREETRLARTSRFAYLHTPAARGCS